MKHSGSCRKIYARLPGVGWLRSRPTRQPYRELRQGCPPMKCATHGDIMPRPRIRMRIRDSQQCYTASGMCPATTKPRAAGSGRPDSRLPRLVTAINSSVLGSARFTSSGRQKRDHHNSPVGGLNPQEKPVYSIQSLLSGRAETRPSRFFTRPFWAGQRRLLASYPFFSAGTDSGMPARIARGR